jgi:hypothetical protein
MNKPKTPNRVRSGEIVLLHWILGLIDIRRRSAQQELKDAIEKKQWSKVPGWDGIDIGLMMAEKIIKEEMQQNTEVSHGGPLTPESKPTANPPFAGPTG